MTQTQNDITKEEIKSLAISQIVYFTKNKEGKTKLWTTNKNFDHSIFCKSIKIKDLQPYESDSTATFSTLRT